LISSLKREEISELIADGTIQGGMIPKVKCCLEALIGGVRKAHIIDGRKDHSILLEIFTNVGIGTEIIP
jgi:acetylglutamate kinase